MMRFCLTLSLALAIFNSSARAVEPKPIRLWLSPAKTPSPPLRYQLLPDARIITSGDAAPTYKEVINLCEKKGLRQRLSPRDAPLIEWSNTPLNKLPVKEMRQELKEFDDVFELLDKAARCDHCDWGILQRLREKGFGALLPEVQSMRECAYLIPVRARLEMAEGHLDKAIQTLRSGFAVARNIGEGDTLINFLIGAAIATIMEKQLDQFVSLPNAPNLYYTLTDLPTPLISMRKSLEGERVSLYGTFPGFFAIVSDLNAGNLSEEDLKKLGKIIDGFSKGDSQVVVDYAERLLIGRNILNRHELAKKALIDAGRPRDKVEAMPHLQVALLHSWLEYDAIMDNMVVWQNLPYWEFVERIPKVQRPLEYILDPNKPAIPLASLLTPAITKVTFARARNDRKIALLRTIEALRLYAASHDGRLPPSLAAIKEVPIPLDPVTGKDFEYSLKDDTATLRAPPPGKETANSSNCVVYELRIRK